MAIYTAASAAELTAALGRANGGDTIRLAPGDYGTLRLNNFRFASAVTVESADAEDWAHFDNLYVNQSTNLQFKGLDLGRELNPQAGEGGYTQLNWIKNSANIRFDQSRFYGSKDGNYNNDGVGLAVYDSSGVRVTNSDFTDLSRGMYVLRSTGTHITNNDIHDIGEDGINVVASTSVAIANNLIRDFHPAPGVHADAIQFFNAGQARGTNNVTIKNNVIWMPEEFAHPDQGVQGIFITPSEHGFRNVLIQNNLIYSNDRWNGLTVSGATNVQVLGNTVLSSSTDSELMWIRLENNTQVSLRNNIMEDTLFRNTSFYTQGANLNLRQTPNLRALFEDLVDPDEFDDLMTAGFGFQMPNTPIGVPGDDDDDDDDDNDDAGDLPGIGRTAAAFEVEALDSDWADVPADDVVPTIAPMATLLPLYDVFTALP